MKVVRSVLRGANPGNGGAYPVYGIEKINEDAAGNCVIVLKFSGNGVPIEGERYYFITKDDAVIRKAHEVSDK